MAGLLTEAATIQSSKFESVQPLNHLYSLRCKFKIGAKARILNRRCMLQCRFKIAAVGYVGGRNNISLYFHTIMNDLQF
jgi:hypothetical protein